MTGGVRATSRKATKDTCSCGRPVVAKGACAACSAKRGVLQRSAASGVAPSNLPPIVRDVVGSSGRPLDDATRVTMELPFGYDFSHVRVHTDAQAAASARAVNAFAYTVGRDVVFDSGNPGPTTREGRKLLAHELAHVVQQSRPGGVTGTSEGAEQEADRAAAHALRGRPVDIRGAVAPAIQRQQKTTSPGRDKAAAPAANAPKLGACKPAQDDLKPSKPWDELQKEYQASCASTFSKGWDDLLGGKAPTSAADAKGAIDCACAVGPPSLAAEAAKARLAVAGPLALALYQHFLNGSGTDWQIDVEDMLRRDAGVRHKIHAAMSSGALTGTTRVEQSDYKVDDFLFAYGGIDCVQWIVTLPPKAKRDGTTPVKIAMLDYYEFHPGRPGVSQCAHAACVELVARGQAKNFWTRGAATVTLGSLKTAAPAKP